MRFVLMPEMTKSREHRIRASLSQTAKAGALHLESDPLQPIEVSHCALTTRDASQDVQHLSCADTARRTLAARFIGGE
jgi:hypothetical protein